MSITDLERDKNNFATKLTTFFSLLLHHLFTLPSMQNFNQEVPAMCPLGVGKLLFTMATIAISELSHSVQILHKIFF